MYKKQDRILAILTAYRDPLLDSAYLDESFLYNTIWRSNHKLLCQPTLIAFPRNECG
jgi:hypothetical protein